MTRCARLLAGLLALLASAATAEARSVSLGYRTRSPRAALSLSLGSPCVARPRVPARVLRTTPRRVWVPGHHQQVWRRVWVDGGYRREWVAPIYETRVDSRGRPVVVVLRRASWSLVEQPGRFEVRRVGEWVDGYWKAIR